MAGGVRGGHTHRDEVTIRQRQVGSGGGDLNIVLAHSLCIPVVAGRGVQQEQGVGYGAAERMPGQGLQTRWSAGIEQAGRARQLGGTGPQEAGQRDSRQESGMCKLAS